MLDWLLRSVFTPGIQSQAPGLCPSPGNSLQCSNSLPACPVWADSAAGWGHTQEWRGASYGRSSSLWPHLCLLWQVRTHCGALLQVCWVQQEGQGRNPTGDLQSSKSTPQSQGEGQCCPGSPDSYWVCRSGKYLSFLTSQLLADTWNADTGATSHREWFCTYSPCSVPICIANGQIVFPAGRGTVEFTPVKGARNLHPVVKAVNELTRGSLGLISHGSESKLRNQWLICEDFQKFQKSKWGPIWRF